MRKRQCAAHSVQASADMVALYDLLPSQARLVLESSDSTVEVPADAVSKGDLIRVLPGDRLPVDGVVVSGRTTVDEAALTGEPMPVVKAVGETVTAGTVNVDGMLLHQSSPSRIDFLSKLRKLDLRNQNFCIYKRTYGDHCATPMGIWVWNKVEFGPSICVPCDSVWLT